MVIQMQSKEASMAARRKEKGGEGLGNTKLARGSRSRGDMEGHDGGKVAQGEEIDAREEMVM